MKTRKHTHPVNNSLQKPYTCFVKRKMKLLYSYKFTMIKSLSLKSKSRHTAR